ncbi:MAG: PAS domain S-box protein [Thaumarchaeota archaeon]|nr:PAS domain S-box protein [Nitrososphaerota archaeon]
MVNMEIDTEFRINQTEVTPHVMETIVNPRKALKVAIDLIESAKTEILVILSTANAFRRQEKTGLLDLLKKVAKEKDVTIRILVPADNAVRELSDRINKEHGKLHIQFIESTLQSKISILIVDRICSLIAELKDDSKETSYEAMGLTTYSSGNPIVLSHVFLFESLWAELELHENIKESNKRLQQSNLQLSSTEKKYKNLYEKSPSLLRSITTDGILTDCNEAYAKSLGYTKEEAIGMSIFDHTAERSIEDMRNDLKKWKKTQQISRMEIWMKRKDGIIFPTLLTGTSLFDEHGILIGRTVALTDLTETHKARLNLQEREARLREQFEELKKLNKKLEVQDKMQKEFINVAAHELRTPIQPIIGLAESLRDKKGNISSQTNLIDVIIKSGKRLQRIAENILDVTRIESNTLKINKEQFNIKDLIYDLFQDFNYHLHSNYKEKDVELKFEAKKDIFVTADRARLTQIIMNLFHNALKFTDKGVITISVERIDDNVLVKVKDTGTGINNDVLSQLFTKFAIQSETGTGLGLFISKNIVEAHGGNMWAENNMGGKGATFAFTIPANWNV